MHLRLFPVLLLGLASLISSPQLLAQQTQAVKWVRAPEARFPRHDIAMPVEFGGGITRVEADSSTTRATRFAHTVLPALAGSYLGFVGGFYSMAAITDSSEENYGTYVFAVGFGAVVSATVVSSISAHKLGVPSDDASFGRSLGGALLGAAPGTVAARMVDGSAIYEIGIGFAVGQGVTTALFTAW